MKTAYIIPMSFNSLLSKSNVALAAIKAVILVAAMAIVCYITTVAVMAIVAVISALFSFVAANIFGIVLAVVLIAALKKLVLR